MSDWILPVLLIGSAVSYVYWGMYMMIEYALSGTLPKYVVFVNGQTLEVRLSPQRKLFKFYFGFKGTMNQLPWRRCIVTDADSGAFVCRGCTFSGASKRAIRRLAPGDPNASFRKLTLAEAEARDAQRNDPHAAEIATRRQRFGARLAEVAAAEGSARAGRIGGRIDRQLGQPKP